MACTCLYRAAGDAAPGEPGGSAAAVALARTFPDLTDTDRDLTGRISATHLKARTPGNEQPPADSIQARIGANISNDNGDVWPEAQAGRSEADDTRVSQIHLTGAVADYGPPPTSWLQTLSYPLRVSRARRQLQRDLSELGHRRARWEIALQRALEAAGEALVAVAQAWVIPGSDLAGDIEAAQRARAQIDHHVEEATRAATSRKHEFAALCHAADEERSRNTQLCARLRVIEERLTRTRAHYTALEARLRAPQRPHPAGAHAPHLATVASTARRAALRELDALRNELQFLDREQARERDQLGAHNAAMNELHDQQVRLLDLAERDAAQHRALADAARSAYRTALAGLARTAQQAGLLARIPQATQAQRAVARTEAQLAAHHEHETRLRAVLDSYDAEANRRGIVALFVVGLVTVSVALTALWMLRAS